MQVKKYIADTLKQALDLAKEELGDDLVLLESKDVENKSKFFKGKKQVEVTVGVDNFGDRVKPWNPPKVSASGEERQPDKEPAAITEEREKNEFNEVLANILNRKKQDFDKEKLILEEIAQLRQQLNQLTLHANVPPTAEKTEASEEEDAGAPAGDRKEKEPAAAAADVLREMEEVGITREVAESLARKGLYDNSLNAGQIRKLVMKEMNSLFKPFDFTKVTKSKGQKRILLLGATGSGKTTTAMKLAASPFLFGKKDVALLASDAYGIPESLKAFAKLTKVAVEEARTMDEIPLALDGLRNKDIVVVDTPGKSPFAPNHLNMLEEYVNLVKPTDIYLILSMSTDKRDLLLSCGFYILLKPTGIIFTKFDETTQPGKVFSVLNEVNIPVVGFCDGTGVFTDISLGRIDYMYKKIFETI